MIQDNIVDLLNRHYAKQVSQAPTRYGSDECPQAWRFIDATIHPWTDKERNHFTTGCPFCARTKELQFVVESLPDGPSDVDEPAFARFFPGINWLIEHATDRIRESPLLMFLNELRSLDWGNPAALTSFNLAAALGVAPPLHFDNEPVEVHNAETESESEEIRALAEGVSVDDPGIRGLLVALATSLRQPEKAIRDLKGLAATSPSIEARLLLALCYYKLGSQEDVEEQIQKSMETIRGKAMKI